MELLAVSEAEIVATDDGSMMVLETVSTELEVSYTELALTVAVISGTEDDSTMLLLTDSTELAVIVSVGRGT